MAGRAPYGTYDKAQRALAKMLKEFKEQSAEERDIAGFRAMVYGFSALLSYFKLAADLRLEERLEAVESMLEEQKRHATSAYEKTFGTG